MKSLFSLFGFVCFIAMLLPTCAPAPETEPEAEPGPQVAVKADKEAISKVGDQLIAALNSDDVDGIMVCLTSDHVTMAPDVPALDDLDTLRKWHEDRVKEVSIEVTSARHEPEVIRDWACQRFNNSITATPKAGGDAVKTENKGIWIWRRQADGSWKLTTSIWNRDNPPPGEPTT
jgi:ketosteroid isomerase-like protein